MAGIADTAKMIMELQLRDKFSAGFAAANKQLGALDKKFGKFQTTVSKGASAAGKNLERGLVLGGVAAAGALTFAVNEAIKWEDAVAGVNKTMDLTPAELKAMEQGLIDLSNRMPVAATDMAAIAEAAGALGIAKKDVLAFTETVALLGATTNVTTEDAATSLGQLQNVIGLTGEDFDNFASALVDLGNKGASTEAQILEIAKRAGGAANLFGIAKEETLGWAAAAANLGLNEELAGTALQQMFIKAMPKFIDGNKTLQTITGKTGAQLKKSFQKDAGAAMESLLKDLGKLPKDARLKAVQSLFGKGSGLTRLVLGLADSFDENLAPSLDTATTAWKENTAATEEAAKRFKTTQSQLAILKNNVTNAAVTIGTAVLPLVNELATEATAWISTHQDDIKRLGQDLAAGLRDAVKWARDLPWDAIKGGLSAAAGFAKTLVDAFASAPPWLQGFLISGWAANKFTGGALADALRQGIGGIAGNLFSRGATPANPLFVADVTGGKGGVPVTGPASKLGAIASFVIPAAALTAIAGAIVVGFKGIVLDPALDKQSGELVTQTQRTIDENKTNTALLESALAAVDTGIGKIGTTPISVALYGQQLADLQRSRQLLQDALGQQKLTAQATTRTDHQQALIAGAIGRQSSKQEQIAAAARLTNTKLDAVRSAVAAGKAISLALTNVVNVKATLSTRDQQSASHITSRYGRMIPV